MKWVFVELGFMRFDAEDVLEVEISFEGDHQFLEFAENKDLVVQSVLGGADCRSAETRS